MKESLTKKLTLITTALCLAAGGAGCSAADKPSTSESSSDSIVQKSQPEAETLEFTENITGSADGYDYELWKDEGDTVFHVEPGGGCFSCEWKNINNALFRRGQKFDCTQTYEELGNISVTA